MGFAQSDGLTGCYRFTPQPQMSIPPLLGCVTRKKKKKIFIDHSGWWAGGSLAVCHSNWKHRLGYAGRNVRQAIHGLAGHLSAVFWRHISTDLWPPLRGTLHETPACVMRVHTHESTPSPPVSASVKIVCFMCLAKKMAKKGSMKSVRLVMKGQVKGRRWGCMVGNVFSGWKILLIRKFHGLKQTAWIYINETFRPDENSNIAPVRPVFVFTAI